MPTYSYACTDCGNRFDVVQAFTEDSLTTCDHCSGRLRKLFSPVGVVFKGSGFYHNDSRASGKSSTNGSGKHSSSDGSAATSSSTEKATPSGETSGAKSDNPASGTSTKAATAASA